MMLQTSLNYYPDSGQDVRLSFGTLFLGLHRKEARLVWFQPAHGAIVGAISQTDDEHMKRILGSFQEFLESIVEELEQSEDVDSFAQAVLQSLPMNFRHGKVTTYPAEDLVPRMMLATHTGFVENKKKVPVVA